MVAAGRTEEVPLEGRSGSQSSRAEALVVECHAGCVMSSVFLPRYFLGRGEKTDTGRHPLSRNGIFVVLYCSTVYE